MKDIIENFEDAADQRLDEMIKGLPIGKFKCGCGNIADLANAVSATTNPYFEPICLKCQGKLDWPRKIRP